MSDQKLTDDELDFVIQVMGEYPAGVCDTAWGYGPMEQDDREDQPHYGHISEPVMEEYG